MSGCLELDVEALKQLLSSMAGRRVAVVGDLMLDEYLIGSVSRISPEAPVPVLEIEREECNLGGAANVASCLTALGAEVRLLGVIGGDIAAAKLHDKLDDARVNADGLIVDVDRPTTCKTRIVAGQQQVVRLDRESRCAIASKVISQLIDDVRKAADWADAIVLSDYAKGVLSEGVCQAAIGAAAGSPVVVDPKALPWERYRGATVVKPNRNEIEKFLSAEVVSDEAAADAAQRLAEALSLDHGLITRSADGMTLATRHEGAWTAKHVRAKRRELVDVTGAGDVTSAALSLALAAEASIESAMWLANVAAGVKVEKFGAATVSPGEILAATGMQQRTNVLSKKEVACRAADWRAQGKRVVFTNGCFDLLHVGHVQYLEDSRKRGDVLVVGVNSDASVQRLKGPSRPVQAESDRARILGSLTSVDAVAIFDEDTPIDLIKAVRPDILTKGKDYLDKRSVVGWDLVEGWGGTVELIEFVEGRSTTNLIQKAA